MYCRFKTKNPCSWPWFKAALVGAVGRNSLSAPVCTCLHQSVCTSVLLLCWDEKWRSDFLLYCLVTGKLKKGEVTHRTGFLNSSLNRKLVYSFKFFPNTSFVGHTVKTTSCDRARRWNQAIKNSLLAGKRPKWARAWKWGHSPHNRRGRKWDSSELDDGEGTLEEGSSEAAP